MCSAGGSGAKCVVFHLGRTCLLLAWFLMSGRVPLGMFGAMLLRLNLRVAETKRSPGHCVFVRTLLLHHPAVFGIRVISFHIQSKINEDDPQHSAASHLFPCHRWTLSPWQILMFKFMPLLWMFLFLLSSQSQVALTDFPSSFFGDLMSRSSCGLMFVLMLFYIVSLCTEIFK